MKQCNLICITAVWVVFKSTSSYLRSPNAIHQQQEPLMPVSYNFTLTPLLQAYGDGELRYYPAFMWDSIRKIVNNLNQDTLLKASGTHFKSASILTFLQVSAPTSTFVLIIFLSVTTEIHAHYDFKYTTREGR
jgi:hypothetical protein